MTNLKLEIARRSQDRKGLENRNYKSRKALK